MAPLPTAVGCVRQCGLCLGGAQLYRTSTISGLFVSLLIATSRPTISLKPGLTLQRLFFPCVTWWRWGPQPPPDL